MAIDRVRLGRGKILVILAGTGVLALAACGSAKKTADSSATTTATTDSGSAPSGSGVCALLTMAEAQAAYREVRVATPEETLAKQNIHACDWAPTPAGRSFEVRVSKSSVADELGMFESGAMDPVKQAKLTREPIADGQVIVGQDGTPGVLQAIGVAAVQKGASTIVVVTSDVAGDQKAVVARLAKLATAAAGRAQ